MNLPLRLENLKRHFATLSMLLSVALSLATGRAQIASVNSYNLPANNTAMSNVVSTGGSIWFLSNINTGDGGYQYYLNSTTPSGVTTQYSLNTTNIPYPVGNSIAVGPDGALWFPAGQDGDGAIVRVTTAGAISTYPLTNPYVFVNGPGSITAGPNNDLWFTDPGSVSGAQVGRVTTSGTFSFFPVTNPAFGITLGPDGNLWATEYTRTAQESSGSYYWTGQVAKITPAGVETRYNMPQVRVLLSGFNETPLDTFATGSDGALWFTEYDGTQVGRVTTSGSVTTVYTGAADGITSGPDGALWLTQPSVSGNGAQTGGPALIQLQTSGTTNSYPLNSDVFDNPSGIAVGPDVALWFNDSSAAVVGQAILKLAITTTQSSVPNGTAGVAYPTTTFGAEYGTTPYSWSAPTTSLPPGLTLSSAGVLSGTPTSAGTFSFTVTVTDSGSPAQTATATFSITIAAGTPASVVATSGSGQSATVNTAFGQALVATILDAEGNPVPGASVTFSAPGTGASGTFAGATGTVTVAANTAGVATSPTFTANGSAGTYSVGASVPGATAASYTLTNNAGAAASITATSGSGQSAAIGSAFANPLVAKVTDASGNPVANASVTFTAPGSGASGTFAGGGATATAATNAFGLATSPIFTANTSAGTYNVAATVAGVTGQATFVLTNSAGSPASIAVVSGSGQSTPIRDPFTYALVVIVKDAGQNIVANATVNFSAPGAGASGTFYGGGTTVATTTGSSGMATAPVFTANAIAGTYTVTASVAGAGNATFSASFLLTNTPSAPANIAATSGLGQSATVATAFASQFSATVTDSGGNPVANASVTFTAPASGASGSFNPNAVVLSATVQTNASGVATAPSFTANTTPGSYNVSAAVSGVTSQAIFPLTNNVGAASIISVSSGNGQFAQVNTPYAMPLVALVTDAYSNPVPNVRVTFTAPHSGASCTFGNGGGPAVSVSTNSSGLASTLAVPAKANAIAGAFTVVISANGLSSTTSLILNNSAGAPGSITITSGSPQSASVGAAFAPLVVMVTDSGGNPVSNATVTFSAPSSGASGTFSGGVTTATATTSAAGSATAPAFTANGTAGSYQVTASVSGAASPVAFNLTNTAGAATSIVASTGTPQMAAVNSAFNNLLVAKVTDANGNPLGGVSVIYTAPGSGASGTFFGGVLSATVLTNSSGIAASPVFSANGVVGTYNVTATVVGVANAADFTLTNAAGVTQPVLPNFSFSGVPSTQAPGASITGATIQLTPASSAAFAGTLTLGFTPNSAYASGLPDGYVGDAGFVSSTGAKSTSDAVTIPAATTSVPLPNIDPGTVAGEVNVNLAVGGQSATTATVAVAASAPTIEANSVQITNVTSTGFNVELVATSTTRELTNATFTFTPAAGATLKGTSFTVDVSSLLSQWFSGSTSLPYGGAFTMTIPFSLSGSASAIQSVSVTVSNSIGTSTAVSGTQ